jgi:hypothetical protein
MNDIEKARTQRDAQRTVASRPTTGSVHPDQGIARRLGVELYKERRHNEKARRSASRSSALP